MPQGTLGTENLIRLVKETKWVWRKIYFVPRKKSSLQQMTTTQCQLYILKHALKSSVNTRAKPTTISEFYLSTPNVTSTNILLILIEKETFQSLKPQKPRLISTLKHLHFMA